jgi:hypothetical protein
VVKPVPDNADMWLTAGVDQLAGTDIGPIDLAPVRIAETVLAPLNAPMASASAPMTAGFTAPIPASSPASVLRREFVEDMS